MNKEAERKKKAEEKEQVKKQKAEVREEERLREARLKLVNKENSSSRRSVAEDGLQEAEISSNECAVCFGLYEDDVADGQLTQEWIQCTETGGGKWMHISV